MNKMPASSLLFWHPALKNHPEVKFVILFKNGMEGYKTLEDLHGDWAYQTHVHGNGIIFQVGNAKNAAATATFK